MPHDGERVFYISTPGGRVVVKTEGNLTERDREVLAEFTRNQERSSDGALGYLGGGLLLVANLAWIMRPEWFGLPHGEGLTPDEESLPARLAFLEVAYHPVESEIVGSVPEEGNPDSGLGRAVIMQEGRICI